jgi:hypothetical protein
MFKESSQSLGIHLEIFLNSSAVLRWHFSATNHASGSPQHPPSQDPLPIPCHLLCPDSPSSAGPCSKPLHHACSPALSIPSSSRKSFPCETQRPEQSIHGNTASKEPPGTGNLSRKPPDYFPCHLHLWTYTRLKPTGKSKDSGARRLPGRISGSSTSCIKP